MEELINSHGIEWNVICELDEGSAEHGWPPSIEITELYALEDPNLAYINLEEVQEDIERQLWLLRDKGRDL